MALVKTEGIILKRIRLGETSKILTVLTASLGKVKLVAKGARKTGHRFGSSMEPFTVCSIVFHHREGRDLEVLSQCDTIESFFELPRDLHRLAYGSGMLELADKAVFGSEPAGEVYALVVKAVGLVAGAPAGELPLIWWAYQMRLSATVGYRPELAQCDGCGREVSGRQVLFAPEAGGVRCGKCCSGGEIRLSGGSLRALQFLSKAPWEEIRSLKVAKQQAGEIEGLLARFLVAQFGESLRVRSLGILKSIPQSGTREGNCSGLPTNDHAAGGVLG